MSDSGDIETAKRQLRQAIGERRREVPHAEALAAGRAVATAVLDEPAVLSAVRVALHASVGGELPTRPVFEALGEAGVERLLPRVRGGALEWALASVWEDLAPGEFGILEPAGDACEPPAPGDLVLLPGLAFDGEGSRLGRGGGYYDRAFPPDAPAPWLVGVGYAFQCVDAVPHDSRDRRVDAIVTERGWVWRPESS